MPRTKPEPAPRPKPEPGVETDGRRARADATRARIAEAMLTLAREGIVDPSAELLAERAGVGRRTVFRLFDDMEGLYRDMHAQMTEKLKPIAAAPLDGADWRQRLDALIDRRARLFEEMLPIKTAGDVHRWRSRFLQREHENLTAMLRGIVLFIVPKTLAKDRDRIEALDLALSFEAWRRLRQEQTLSPKNAVAVLKRMAAALLD